MPSLHPMFCHSQDLEPAAWGGGRFPVQVRFTPAQPSGRMLVLKEALLSEVLRYRTPSTRFDLLLRGKPLDRYVSAIRMSSRCSVCPTRLRISIRKG